MANKRKIHFKEETWEYQVRPRSIIIWPPNKAPKKIIDVADFLGWDQYQFERACYKGNRPPVTPSNIKDYISKNLMDHSTTKRKGA